MMKPVAHALILAVFLILGCLGSAPVAQAQSANAYTLGVGDKIHVTVFNEPDLTGDFSIDDQGFVSLPLIGQVHIAGLTPSQAQVTITQKYAANYLVNPRVNVDVMNYRPFFILGEVRSPGSYPYVNGMTVLNAVVYAGGYTPRGDRYDIVVKHSDDPSGQSQKIGENDPVRPGDIIRVNQKLF
jgi:protein involved in polysaccharide export with SLBB domain